MEVLFDKTKCCITENEGEWTVILENDNSQKLVFNFRNFKKVKKFFDRTRNDELRSKFECIFFNLNSTFSKVGLSLDDCIKLSEIENFFEQQELVKNFQSITF